MESIAATLYGIISYRSTQELSGGLCVLASLIQNAVGLVIKLQLVWSQCLSSKR